MLLYKKDNKESQKNQGVGKYKLKKEGVIALLAYIVRHVSELTAERIHTCGDWLAFAMDATKEIKKLIKANFCGNRFCPMCAWRLAKKEALKIAVLMQYIKQTHDKEFLFLTLTTPNVMADKLAEEITRYNKAFKKLMERKEIRRAVKGYIRKLEVTYNSEEFITPNMWNGNKAKHINSHKDHFERRGLQIGDRNPNYNTYHPHFHVLIAVNKTYFDDSTQYIKKSKWLALWQEVMQDKTITRVTIQKVKANAGKEVLEMAKYSTKDSDYLISQEVFDVFYKALKGRQVITYSGLFAEAHQLYKLKDTSKNLDHLKEQDNTEYVYWLLYQWGKGEYVEAEFRELTEEERKQINKQLIDEVEVEE